MYTVYISYRYFLCDIFCIRGGPAAHACPHLGVSWRDPGPVRLSGPRPPECGTTVPAGCRYGAPFHPKSVNSIQTGFEEVV